MKIFVTDQGGTRHELEAVEGWRVMEIIRDYGLPIKAECGGACACATCHVYVAENWIDRIPGMRDEEQDMLDMAFEVQDNSRLSCQIIMNEDLNGLELTLAVYDA
ncbi:MAG: 2Fe-2S iron-sulfur cluster-binding protein [Alphaproteobacteria bacterium]|nr:2Fe-2S iron-sulfur cluster-binding protein [Alphaproteobacteria bacterium]MCD8520588.1 2Fe-2S iron-sulfur cluster-binding protein [Alphaproteobacteria bacterium]MCD8525801.1 2Fe-2S iron-sulfur cluster-binding protein [Alphaproteobacteria bacterium]MCD8571421.1 2Fe-2S iron-sulfur cluster-binding protein [Alphaproteobacteria bacterium]